MRLVFLAAEQGGRGAHAAQPPASLFVCDCHTETSIQLFGGFRKRHCYKYALCLNLKL